MRTEPLNAGLADRDQAIGYLLRRAQQVSAAALEPIFADERLTGTMWSALMLIHLDRSSTCADIARDLGHDKGATTRLVDALEARGLLARQRCGDDRRLVHLRITGEGRAVADRCKERVFACWARWLGDWPQDDVATLVRLLQRLRHTLERAA